MITQRVLERDGSITDWVSDRSPLSTADPRVRSGASSGLVLGLRRAAARRSASCGDRHALTDRPTARSDVHRVAGAQTNSEVLHKEGP